MIRSISLVTAAILVSQLAVAQPAPPATPAPAATPTPAATAAAAKPGTEEAPVIRKHQITLNGKPLAYTTTTGMMPIRNAAGDVEASMFFIAYTLDGVADKAKRRLMFSFNGGPGSASVWLHIGAIGPKRVRMMDDGNLPPAPYRMELNEGTLLDQADLVFIDPVGTGYSRAAKPELAKKFFSLQGDIDSVGEFIRMYLTRYERWLSPLFLIGESYGTTRAAGLSGHLLDRGIALNGIALVSTILNFQTARFGGGNDSAYPLILPTYTATAWYHKKLAPELKDRKKLLDEVEKWALGGYTEALAKGDSLTPAERKAVVEKLARYTGLNSKVIEDNDLRVDLSVFRRELLRDKDLVVGRLDARITGAPDRSERGVYDPSMTAIRPPYTAAFGDYVRTELGYQSDLTYYILGGGIGQWDFNSNNSYADVSSSLRDAFVKNPHMKLYIGFGFYDCATPYFAAQYTVAHMSLPKEARANIREHFYEAGHMYYIHFPSLKMMKADVGSFLGWAAPVE